jgi:hypothetical protein
LLDNAHAALDGLFQRRDRPGSISDQAVMAGLKRFQGDLARLDEALGQRRVGEHAAELRSGLQHLFSRAQGYDRGEALAWIEHAKAALIAYAERIDAMRGAARTRKQVEKACAPFQESDWSPVSLSELAITKDDAAMAWALCVDRWA